MAISLALELIGASAIARSRGIGLLSQPPRKTAAERANRARRVVLEVRQLEYFVAICDAGSMSKASTKLCVARSALSAQLGLLEAELGAILVGRLPIGIVPTESGRILYEHAQAILLQLRAAKLAVRQSCESPHGTITIGMPESVSAVLGLPLLRAIKDRFPGITLQLHEDVGGTVLGQLKDGQLDLAVVFSNGPLEGLTVERIAEEKLYLISKLMRNGAPRSKTVTLATALSSPLILSDVQHGVRARIEECAKTAGYHIANLMAETNSLTVIKNAVLDGMALTILPISAVISELERELMLVQEIVNPGVSCTVSVCWPKSITTNHAALCVARLIAAVATEVRATGRWPGAQAAHDSQS